MITVKSPTRVDLAGGTLDCWPLHLFVGDCQTVNLAIDIFTGCDLVTRTDSQIYLEVQDLKYSKEFSNLNEFLESEDPQLLLIRKVVEFFRPTFGFRLRTYSQSPVGGGLGGSSSLCISLIKAFQKQAGLQMGHHERVELAHNLEAKVIRSPTGTQDYYPALLGGLNIIHYLSSGIEVEPVISPVDIFEKNMVLVYTGRSHHSGINNWQVIKSVIEGDQSALTALRDIAQISMDVAQACRAQNWPTLPSLFRSEFDARTKLSESFCSDEIDKLKKLVVNEGAQAVKICGAGGGGCVFVWADPDAHERIIKVCQENKFQVLPTKPVDRLLEDRIP